MTSWVLVADSRRAKLFNIEDARCTLSEVADFTHPVASQHGDNPAGHTFGASTGTRHGLEPATLPQEKEVRAFAVELAKYLQHEFSQQHFSKLILVAAPEFLGELRAALSDSLRAAVSASIAKDLLSYADADLSNYLRSQPGIH